MTHLRKTFPVQDIELSDFQQRILGSAIIERNVPRGSIARRAGVSLQTVMRAVLPMIASDLIEEVAQSQGQRGQPERIVTPASNRLGVIGISIRDHQLHVLLQDVTGNIIWEEVDHSTASTPTAVLQRIEDLLHVAVRQVLPGMKILGAGVSVQGFFADRGRVVVSRGDPAGWAATNLGGTLGEMLTLPILIENDARILAGNYLAQHPECQHRIFVLLDSGIGGGVISEGKLLRGNTGNAGSFGALVPDSPFRPTDENIRMALGCEDWTDCPPERLLQQLETAECWLTEAGKRLDDIFYAALATTGITKFSVVSPAPEIVIRTLLEKVPLTPVGHKFVSRGVPRDILSSPSVTIEPFPVFASAAAWAYLAALPHLPMG